MIGGQHTEPQDVLKADDCLKFVFQLQFQLEWKKKIISPNHEKYRIRINMSLIYICPIRIRCRKIYFLYITKTLEMAPQHSPSVFGSFW